jgi:DNA polymerase (family 10)
LQKLASKKGFSFNETGLYRNEKIVAARTEAEIYGALGLSFIEPELREGRGEIALARKKQLPTLVRLEDIHGILHTHTTASDGVNTLRQMAEATRKRGYSYLVSLTTRSLLITLAGLASTRLSLNMSLSMS